MKYKLLIVNILVAISLSFYTQNEKRLALVIGNSDYEKGELKNPVVDALLMKNTLDSLDFEVLYHENISSREEIYKSFKEFARKLDSVDVSMIYYAGHGIQVNGKNYLVPTKVELKDEDDVEAYCYPFNKAMEYLSKYKDKVNIIVLDACRDNPFESSWSGRSYGGNGLADIESPDGCIIAYSTKTGKVASDNSYYAKYLCQYMQEPGLEIKNVFQKVRIKVNDLSNGKQTPVETHQMLTDFYLKKKSYEEELQKIKSLYKNKAYSDALSLIAKIITIKEEKNDAALPNDYFLKSKIHWKIAIKLKKSKETKIANKEFNNAIENITHAIELKPDSSNYYCFRGFLHQSLNNNEKALSDFNKAINLDPNNGKYYHERGRCFLNNNDSLRAKVDFLKSIVLSPNDKRLYYHRESIYEPHEPYFFRSTFFEEFKNYPKAFEFFENQLKKEPKNADLYFERSGLYYTIGEYRKSIKDLITAFSFDNKNSDIFHFRSLIYTQLGVFKKAEEDAFKFIQISPDDPSGYYLLANMYEKNGDSLNAIMKYSEAISKLTFHIERFHIPTLNDNNFTLCDLYNKRSELFKEQGHKVLMCEDLLKAAELENCKVQNLNECK